MPTAEPRNRGSQARRAALALIVLALAACGPTVNPFHGVDAYIVQSDNDNAQVLHPFESCFDRGGGRVCMLLEGQSNPDACTQRTHWVQHQGIWTYCVPEPGRDVNWQLTGGRILASFASPTFGTVLVYDNGLVYQGCTSQGMDRWSCNYRMDRLWWRPSGTSTWVTSIKVSNWSAFGSGQQCANEIIRIYRGGVPDTYTSLHCVMR